MSQVRSSDGLVAVTGASGHIGSHVVLALVKRGYTVRACVTDESKPEKTAHLRAMNSGVYPGRVELRTGNLLEQGSYDAIFAGCAAVMHGGTPMGYANLNKPRQIYDGAVNGTTNVLESVKRAGSARRVVYTSSFSAIAHPAPPGYVFSEKDWASSSHPCRDCPTPSPSH